MTVQETGNIFSKIGGINAVHEIVDLFYDKVLADPRVNFFFKDADMNVQRGKMKAFLMMALGGPVKFTGKDMRLAHTHLVRGGLRDSHFDAVAVHLVAALRECGVDDSVCSQIATMAERVRAEVLNK
ncbi:MAG TPA: group 1 truncated hemoglobin [Cyclobacteriaceae bacterium]|jgi:hemoglobin